MANEVTPKPRWKEREFWFTLGGYALGTAVMLGYLTPEQSSTISTAASEIAGSLIIGLSAFGYNLSRGIAKRPPVA